MSEPEVKLPPDELLSKLAREVEAEFGMGGLSGGLYEDYASEIANRFARTAVLAERERCAKLCDAIHERLTLPAAHGAELCAAVIRKGEA